jgi:hypothetical protein
VPLDPSAGLSSRIGRQCGTTLLANLPGPMLEQETGLIVVNAKKVAGLVGIALVVFFVIAQPGNAANLVTNILDFLRNSAEAVINFATALFK